MQRNIHLSFITISGRRLTIAFLAALFLLALLPAHPVSAATPIYVRPDGHDTYCNGTTNDPYPGSGSGGLNCAVQTIQQGIDLVDPSGTVIIAAGTYTESNITVSKALTITGESRAGVIILPAAQDDHTYELFGGTFQHGFIINSSDVTIRDLSLDGNGNDTLTGTLNFRAGIVTTDTSNLDHNLHIFWG
jgi:hypothetical protein